MYVNVTILFSGKHLERKTLFLAGKHILWATRTGFSAFILQQPSAVATVTASVLVLSPYPRPFLHDFSSDHSGILVSLSRTCIMLHFNSLIKVSLKPGATHTVLFQPSGLNLHFLARWWSAHGSLHVQASLRPCGNFPATCKETVPAHWVSIQNHAWNLVTE